MYEVMVTHTKPGSSILQLIKASSDPSCRMNKALQTKTDKADAKDTNANVPDYLNEL